MTTSRLVSWWVLGGCYVFGRADLTDWVLESVPTRGQA